MRVEEGTNPRACMPGRLSHDEVNGMALSSSYIFVRLATPGSRSSKTFRDGCTWRRQVQPSRNVFEDRDPGVANLTKMYEDESAIPFTSSWLSLPGMHARGFVPSSTLITLR